jgi:hypothetical protein
VTAARLLCGGSDVATSRGCPAHGCVDAAGSSECQRRQVDGAPEEGPRVALLGDDCALSPSPPTDATCVVAVALDRIVSPSSLC